MTDLNCQLVAMGARLWARQIMARAALREEQEQQQRQREEQARRFWDEVGRGIGAGVLRWPGRGAE